MVAGCEVALDHMVAVVVHTAAHHMALGVDHKETPVVDHMEIPEADHREILEVEPDMVDTATVDTVADQAEETQLAVMEAAAHWDKHLDIVVAAGMVVRHHLVVADLRHPTTSRIYSLRMWS